MSVVALTYLIGVIILGLLRECNKDLFNKIVDISAVGLLILVAIMVAGGLG